MSTVKFNKYWHVGNLSRNTKGTVGAQYGHVSSSSWGTVGAKSIFCSSSDATLYIYHNSVSRGGGRE